jgi:hypothetical protein
MYKQSNKKKLLIIFFIMLIPCATYSYDEEYSYDRLNPYPNMEILRYANSQAYVFPNTKTDKLMIVIEGSGSASVLGIRQGNTWTGVGMITQLLQELANNFTVLLPEKLKRQPGINYVDNIEDRANYTAENLLVCYSESINNYLVENVCSSIVLVGVSEGALLLPLIYERMENRNSVAAMVALNFGRYSLYESYKILSELPETPIEYRNIYKHIIEVYEYIEYLKTHNVEIEISPTEDFYGFNYRWYNSFLGIRPIDYYERINISILFTHGKNDFRVPVDSTLYIQNNLPEKPFDFLYFPWSHQPETISDMVSFRKEIAGWIMNHLR